MRNYKLKSNLKERDKFMRFPQAWASIAKQNNVLRIAVIGVSISGALALLISLKFAFKDPLIIERGCFAKAVSKTSNQEPTKEEFEAFINESLAQRFNSDSNVTSENIPIKKINDRDIEEKQIKRRYINKRNIENSVV